MGGLAIGGTLYFFLIAVANSFFPPVLIASNSYGISLHTSPYTGGPLFADAINALSLRSWFAAYVIAPWAIALLAGGGALYAVRRDVFRKAALTDLGPGDLSIARDALRLGADPDDKNDSGETLLMRHIDNSKVARLPIENGASLKAQTIGHLPVIDYALRSLRTNPEAFKMLVERGEDVNAKASGLTALDRAVRQQDTEFIKWLIAHGADSSGALERAKRECQACIPLLTKSSRAVKP